MRTDFQLKIMDIKILDIKIMDIKIMDIKIMDIKIMDIKIMDIIHNLKQTQTDEQYDITHNTREKRKIILPLFYINVFRFYETTL